MNFEKADYVLDLEGNKTAIVAEVDGAQMSIPISEGNRHYAGLIASGVALAMPKPVEPSVPNLTPRQWNLLLDTSGSRGVLDAVLDAMPKSTPEEKFAWAQMKATALNSGTYTWDTTIKLIAGIRSMGVQGIPSDEELRSYWDMASKDKGL